MLAHELAKKLLEGPNDPVYITVRPKPDEDYFDRVTELSSFPLGDRTGIELRAKDSN